MGYLQDLGVTLTGGILAGIGGLTVKWLGERRRKHRELGSLLANLVTELAQNEALPRQARTKIKTDALGRAINETSLDPQLLSVLSEVDRFTRVIASFSDRQMPIQTVDQVFESNFIPCLGRALPLVQAAKRKCDSMKWWKPWQRL